MKLLLKTLGLWLLLVVTQHGAVVHELSDASRVGLVGVQVDGGDSVVAPCALCPAFAQVVTPAFSHTFEVPPPARADILRSREPLFAAIVASVPAPRSRGPPTI
jgi:hypothetical protein